MTPLQRVILKNLQKYANAGVLNPSAAVAPNTAPAIPKVNMPGPLTHGINLAGSGIGALGSLTHTDEQGKWDPSYLAAAINGGFAAHAGKQLINSGGLKGLTAGNIAQTGLNTLKTVGPRGLARGVARGAGTAALGSGLMYAAGNLAHTDTSGNWNPQWAGAAHEFLPGAAIYGASRMLTKAPVAAPVVRGVIARTAGRAVPLLGAGLLAGEASNQIGKGNYLGGALNAGAALTTAVPPVSFALQGAASLTDIYGDAQRAYRRAGQLQQANQQMLRDEAAGRTQTIPDPQYLTPSGVRG